MPYKARQHPHHQAVRQHGECTRPWWCHRCQPFRALQTPPATYGCTGRSRRTTAPATHLESYEITLPGEGLDLAGWRAHWLAQKASCSIRIVRQAKHALGHRHVTGIYRFSLSMHETSNTKHHSGKTRLDGLPGNSLGAKLGRRSSRRLSPLRVHSPGPVQQCANNRCRRHPAGQGFLSIASKASLRDSLQCTLKTMMDSTANCARQIACSLSRLKKLC